jgi:prephenate dehydratase
VRLTDPDHVAAFLGLEGSHSDVACRTFLPYARALPCGGFEDVLDAVEAGRATLGLVPVQNSIAGRVGDNDLLVGQSSLAIVGEYFHPVEHCLLGLPGASIAQLTTAYSHPQAIAQCRRWLQRHGLESVPFSDTARAAQHVQRLGDARAAAIGTALAATLYGLDVLASGVNDDRDNVTHFLLLARESAELEAAPGRTILTSATFSTRNIPAGLYKALGGFATNGVNLLKIDSSMPVHVGQANARFFVTFEGAATDRRVQLALEELSFFSTHLRVLGSYPADPFRAEGPPRAGR